MLKVGPATDDVTAEDKTVHGDARYSSCRAINVIGGLELMYGSAYCSMVYIT